MATWRDFEKLISEKAFVIDASDEEIGIDDVSEWVAFLIRDILSLFRKEE